MLADDAPEAQYARKQQQQHVRSDSPPYAGAARTYAPADGGDVNGGRVARSRERDRYRPADGSPEDRHLSPPAATSGRYNGNHDERPGGGDRFHAKPAVGDRYAYHRDHQHGHRAAGFYRANPRQNSGSGGNNGHGNHNSYRRDARPAYSYDHRRTRDANGSSSYRNDVAARRCSLSTGESDDGGTINFHSDEAERGRKHSRQNSESQERPHSQHSDERGRNARNRASSSSGEGWHKIREVTDIKSGDWHHGDSRFQARHVGDTRCRTGKHLNDDRAEDRNDGRQQRSTSWIRQGPSRTREVSTQWHHQNGLRRTLNYDERIRDEEVGSKYRTSRDHRELAITTNSPSPPKEKRVKKSTFPRVGSPVMDTGTAQYVIARNVHAPDEQNGQPLLANESRRLPMMEETELFGHAHVGAIPQGFSAQSAQLAGKPHSQTEVVSDYPDHLRAQQLSNLSANVYLDARANAEERSGDTVSRPSMVELNASRDMPGQSRGQPVIGSDGQQPPLPLLSGEQQYQRAPQADQVRPELLPQNRPLIPGAQQPPPPPGFPAQLLAPQVPVYQPIPQLVGHQYWPQSPMLQAWPQQPHMAVPMTPALSQQPLPQQPMPQQPFQQQPLPQQPQQPLPSQTMPQQPHPPQAIPQQMLPQLPLPQQLLPQQPQPQTLLATHIPPGAAQPTWVQYTPNHSWQQLPPQGWARPIPLAGPAIWQQQQALPIQLQPTWVPQAWAQQVPQYAQPVVQQGAQQTSGQNTFSCVWTPATTLDGYQYAQSQMGQQSRSLCGVPVQPTQEEIQQAATGQRQVGSESAGAGALTASSNHSGHHIIYQPTIVLIDMSSSRILAPDAGGRLLLGPPNHPATSTNVSCLAQTEFTSNLLPPPPLLVRSPLPAPRDNMFVAAAVEGQGINKSNAFDAVRETTTTINTIRQDSQPQRILQPQEVFRQATVEVRPGQADSVQPMTEDGTADVLPGPTSIPDALPRATAEKMRKPDDYGWKMVDYVKVLMTRLRSDLASAQLGRRAVLDEDADLSSGVHSGGDALNARGIFEIEDSTTRESDGDTSTEPSAERQGISHGETVPSPDMTPIEASQDAKSGGAENGNGADTTPAEKESGPSTGHAFHAEGVHHVGKTSLPDLHIPALSRNEESIIPGVAPRDDAAGATEIASVRAPEPASADKGAPQVTTFFPGSEQSAPKEACRRVNSPNPLTLVEEQPGPHQEADSQEHRNQQACILPSLSESRAAGNLAEQLSVKGALEALRSKLKRRVDGESAATGSETGTAALLTDNEPDRPISSLREESSCEHKRHRKEHCHVTQQEQSLAAEVPKGAPAVVGASGHQDGPATVLEPVAVRSPGSRLEKSAGALAIDPSLPNFVTAYPRNSGSDGVREVLIYPSGELSVDEIRASHPRYRWD